MQKFDNYAHGYTEGKTNQLPDNFIPHIEKARRAAAKLISNESPNRLKITVVLGELSRMASDMNAWDIDERRVRDTIHLAMDFISDCFSSIGL